MAEDRRIRRWDGHHRDALALRPPRDRRARLRVAPALEPSVLVAYVDRCSSCACSSLRDTGGRRPVPGVIGCGRTCRCHAAQHAHHATLSTLASDAARFRLFRRTRAQAQQESALR